MKLKYYLRGLGIGILVTTLIFMIGIKVNGDKLMSDQDVISRAEELGMVKGDSQDKPKTLEELEEEQKKNQEKQEEENKKQETQQPEPKDEAEKTNEKKKNEADQTNKKSVDKVEQVEVSILPGEYSDAICQKLLDAGIIDNKDDFKSFLDSSEYDNLIQPGTFTIPKGSAYEEIAKILTTKQEFR